MTFHRPRRIAATLICVLPLGLMSCGAGWQTDPAKAVELVRTGQYAAGVPALEAAVDAGSTDPLVVGHLFYAWTRQGLYSKALEKFEAWATRDPQNGPVRLAAARVNRLAGRNSEALAHLETIQNHSGIAMAARREKGELLLRTGKSSEADAVFAAMVQQYQDGVARAPGDLAHVAIALKHREYFHDANDVFKAATQADPRNAEAFVDWGDLLAEKYNSPEAMASYGDALKIDANLPSAHLGVARVMALENPERSTKALEKALEVNPNYVEAHLLTAEQHIDSEEHDKASAVLDRVLAINGASLEAMAFQATIHFLRDNKTAFNQAVERVLGMNPGFSTLFTTLADSCVSVRLYKQAVIFAREAIRLNPRDWRAHSILGVNLLRTGREEEGKKALETAYEGDSFNVWTVNTLTLLDSFDKFDRFETEHFRIKLHNKESAALIPYVKTLLEKAYADLTRKYQFEPEGPITFEMYPDHADFAVRTLGLPGIGALGVCFGMLVAMDSPSGRKPDTFNWASTLWHEFAHVITLQITDHKIPRWFSEGLSVYEERKAFPGWGDDLKIEFLTMIQEKKFLHVAELNAGFTRPRFPEQVLLSYYQASLICDYIEQTYGFPAILRMLGLYKNGKDTPAVFQEALGVSLDEFDQGFTGFVEGRIRGIDTKSFRELITSGRELLEKGETDKAIEALDKAVQMYPEYSEEMNPYEPLADAYLKKGDKRRAMEVLRKFSSFSDTGYAGHIKLAGLAAELNDTPGSIRALEGALYIRPLDIETHVRLGGALLSEKQFARAAAHFETLLALNAPDKAGTYFKLAEARFGEGNRTEARRNLLRCLEIAPSYEPAQELLLKIVR